MPKVKAKKPQLRNLLSKEECLKRLAQEDFRRMTLSFYRYVEIQDPVAFRDQLYKEWTDLGVFGRIYVAKEGINAQLNVPEHNFAAFKANLESHPELQNLRLNIAIDPYKTSFYKLNIKVRELIVADGLPEGTYDLSKVGKHLNPEEFNAALDDENTILVDMRNFYESKIGRFENARCPDSNTFKEELEMVHEELKGKEDKKLLMYCTGGVRCEKASAYFLKQGFKDVNQLEGGIIYYLKQAQAKGVPVKFHGKNYVFDERTSEPVTDEVLAECDQCDAKWDGYVNCKNATCNLLFLQCPACAEKFNHCCSNECRAIYELPEEERRAYYAKQKESDYNVYVSRIRPRLKAKA